MILRLVKPSFLPSVLGGLFFCGQVFGQEISRLSVVTQAVSDWTYHGVSETRGEPAIGVNIDWQHSPHLFFGLEAHQAIVSAERQRESSFMVYIGTGRRLLSNWYATWAIQHRSFPGSTKPWDLTEFTTSLTHSNGFKTNLSYSPDYYEHNTGAFNVTLGYTHQTKTPWFWLVETGTTQFVNSDPVFSDYEHVRFGVGRSFDRTNISLSYRWTSANALETFGRESNQSPGLVVDFSYRIH